MAGFSSRNDIHKCRCNAKGCKCDKTTKHNWCADCSMGKHTVGPACETAEGCAGEVTKRNYNGGDVYFCAKHGTP